MSGAVELKFLLDRLNPEQKLASQALEGPVQVIAGPGTGKTQILASRITNILSQTDVHPHNVLCLTYTEAGVVAMRERLFQFMGATAHQVEIHTFHSLCNQIIQENASAFGTSQLSPLDDVEKEQVMNQVCESIKPNSPLYNNYDPYLYAYDLQNIFGELKKENLSYEKVKSLGITELESLKNDTNMFYTRSGKGYKKGDFKEKEFQKIKARIEKVIEAARLLGTYKKIMNKLHRYDYHDMILWVLEAFDNNKDLLAQYQEQFQYVLVDEFQDTNASQFEILEKLMGHWDSPNIFSVGDDDQSIFAFQGANVKNMQLFGSKFSTGLSKFVLKINYRSTPEILAVAKKSIGYNQLRLVNMDENLNKDLQAFKPSSTNKPCIRSFKNALHEASWIGGKIEELIQQGVKAKSIGVIYPKHKLALPLKGILESKEIAYEMKFTASVFDASSVKFMFQAIQYVYSELKKPFSGDHQLFMLLHAPCFGLDSLKLAAKSFELSKKREKNKLWRFALQQESPDLFNSAPIAQTMQLIESWVQFAAQNSPLALINKILLESNVLKLYENPGENYQDINALESFFSFIQSRNEKNQKYNLQTCLTELDVLRDAGALKTQQSIQADDGVQFMTAHGSKGLEFEHVFVIGCNSNHWEKKRNTAKINLKYLFPLLADTDDEEVRRLFYVAITRAEDYLYLSYCQENDSGKAQSESQFITEVRDHSIIEELKESIEGDHLVHSAISILQNSSDKVVKRDQELVAKALENYKLSASHLNSYLACPTAFYYEKVLRVPGAKPEAVVVGNAVHKAFEQAFINYNATQTFPAAESILKQVEAHLLDNRIHFNEANFENKLAYTKDYVKAYYESKIPLWKTWTNVKTEQAIGSVVREVPLKGFMDLVVMTEGNYIKVIDFKTGKPENASKKMVAPKFDYEGDDLVKKYGGDYWRQLMFYYFLVDYSVQNNWKVQSAAVSCVEKEKQSGNVIDDLALIPTQEERDFMANLIAKVYSNIKAFKFNDGCGNTDPNDRNHRYCMWCDFEQNGW